MNNKQYCTQLINISISITLIFTLILLKNMNTRIIFLSISLAILKCRCAEDPWTDGPHEAVRRLYLMSLTGLNHELDVWAPDTPGKVPILYMMGGMGTLFPGDLYGDVWQQ